MNVNRLKAINHQIDALFRQPLPVHTPAHLPAPNYQPCPLCEEVRRENYRLKQREFDREEGEQETDRLRRELEGLRELYELKCRETELLTEKLQSAEIRVVRGEEQNAGWRRESAEYLQGLLDGRI
jgi:hypothetical protein